MVQLLKKVCRSDEACLADKDDVGMQRIDTREEMRKNNIDQMFESLGVKEGNKMDEEIVVMMNREI